MHRIKVMICGKEYSMQTKEKPDYVYGLARTLEAKITDSMDKMKVSQYNAAVMAALSVLDDLQKANAQIQEISDQMKLYVDEAGQARIERDTAMKEIRLLRARVEQLEMAEKQKNLKNLKNSNSVKNAKQQNSSD
ncbi:MAG: cell division protein ZapA [Oscillospiraceae bacterium]|nr:cell division protein ZapA [Oscillospiraceae bacterium]MDE5885034.1 cell division protein ZapA [Oscillospiraceae bacterium]